MSRLIPNVLKKARAPSTSTSGTSGPGVGTETLVALQATLTILRDSVDGIPVPGLKASLGGLLALLTAIRVSCHATCCRHF
jgi:hypothetical protein